HSAGLGRGSEFEVRLPLAGDDAKPAAEPPRATAPRTLSILIIEDSVDVAESMQMLLEMEGHEVSVAHDGVEGVAKARATSPDVVLCDLGLPKMNGYAVARSLVADLELANTLLVAISGYALPEDVERSMAAGFHHHLAKPV